MEIPILSKSFIPGNRNTRDIGNLSKSFIPENHNSRDIGKMKSDNRSLCSFREMRLSKLRTITNHQPLEALAQSDAVVPPAFKSTLLDAIYDRMHNEKSEYDPRSYEGTLDAIPPARRWRFKLWWFRSAFSAKAFKGCLSVSICQRPQHLSC